MFQAGYVVLHFVNLNLNCVKLSLKLLIESIKFCLKFFVKRVNFCVNSCLKRANSRINFLRERLKLFYHLGAKFCVIRSHVGKLFVSLRKMFPQQ